MDEEELPADNAVYRFLVNIQENFSFKKLMWAFVGLLVLIGAFQYLTTDFMTRQEADQRLSNACTAAVRLYLEEQKVGVSEFMGMTITNTTYFHDSYREVTLSIIESTEEYDREKQYQCAFHDHLPWFAVEHIAAPYQFKMDKVVFTASEAQAADAPDVLKQMVKAVDLVFNPPPPEEQDEKGWFSWITG